MIRCAGCGRGTAGQTFACCGRGWCHYCYQPHIAHILEPSLVGVDLADVHAAPRRRKPEWDAPVNSPSPWVFAAIVIWIIVVVFAALEYTEWIFGGWGG